MHPFLPLIVFCLVFSSSLLLTTRFKAPPKLLKLVSALGNRLALNMVSPILCTIISTVDSVTLLSPCFAIVSLFLLVCSLSSSVARAWKDLVELARLVWDGMEHMGQGGTDGNERPWWRGMGRRTWYRRHVKWLDKKSVRVAAKRIIRGAINKAASRSPRESPHRNSLTRQLCWFTFMFIMFVPAVLAAQVTSSLSLSDRPQPPSVSNSAPISPHVTPDASTSSSSLPHTPTAQATTVSPTQPTVQDNDGTIKSSYTNEEEDDMLDTAEEVHQQDASDTIEVEEEPEQTMIKRRRNNERRKLRLKSATTRPRRTAKRIGQWQIVEKRLAKSSYFVIENDRLRKPERFKWRSRSLTAWMLEDVSESNFSTPISYFGVATLAMWEDNPRLCDVITGLGDSETITLDQLRSGTRMRDSESMGLYAFSHNGVSIYFGNTAQRMNKRWSQHRYKGINSKVRRLREAKAFNEWTDVAVFEASDDYPPATLYALELLFNLLIDATSPNHLNINVIDFARYEAIATAAQVTSYFRAVAKVLEENGSQMIPHPRRANEPPSLDAITFYSKFTPSIIPLGQFALYNLLLCNLRTAQAIKLHQSLPIIASRFVSGSLPVALRSKESLARETDRSEMRGSSLDDRPSRKVDQSTQDKPATKKLKLTSDASGDRSTADSIPTSGKSEVDEKKVREGSHGAWTAKPPARGGGKGMGSLLRGRGRGRGPGRGG